MILPMQGFPPLPSDQVTLANWREAPFNRWAFQHVRELLPSAEIENDPRSVVEWRLFSVDASDWHVADDAQRAMSFAQFLEKTATDAIVIVHRGRIVFEHSAPGSSTLTPHILMSVSKSMLGLVAEILVARKELDANLTVGEILPELGATAYTAATLRHLLDMRAGVHFDEDYAATEGPIVDYRKATGWNPLQIGEAPSDLRSFFRLMTKSDPPHGGNFHYVSPNSDLLGWLIERATGTRFSDLMSELLWRPAGASRSGYITVDRFGAPRCAGGICVCARDLALVGQLLLDDGARAGKQILPAGWVHDLIRNGDQAAWAAGSFVDYFPGRAMHYRSQWYVENEPHALLFGVGIHGQNLFVDPARQIVIAKLSSQAQPLDMRDIALTMRAVSAVQRSLTE